MIRCWDEFHDKYKKLTAKKDYDVFVRRQINNPGTEWYEREFYVGTTVAVSPEQAVNNVRYNYIGKAPNIIVTDCPCDGCVVDKFVAYPSDENHKETYIQYL